jgi:ornithine cyclodeaminase
MHQPRWIGAAEVRQAVGPNQARRLVQRALLDGFDPAADPPRSSPTVRNGQLLVMPSQTPAAVGVKVLSVAPRNPAQGRERIQALYVLMDVETLTPSILLDGTAITALRTPAVSALGMDALAPQQVSKVVIFGSGPQAVRHAEALLQLRRPDELVIVARRPDAGAAAADTIAAHGVPARTVGTDDRGAVEEAVRSAQVVVTATSAGAPVLDGDWVADGACVVAIGSHEPDRRELDGALMHRSLVVVEDTATALREAGDVIMAVAEGALGEAALGTLRDLVLGRVVRAEDRPNVFKTVGMSWEDLVIAVGVAHAVGAVGA